MSGVKRNYAQMLRSGSHLRPPVQESPMKQYSFDRPFPQQFSLPSPTVMYLIKRHKTRNLHINFMKLCKYTYAKNRIVPVSKIIYHHPKTRPHYWTAVWNGIGGKKGKFDLDNGNFKLWIVPNVGNPRMESIGTFPDAASKLASKLYRCDAKIIIQNQIISFDNFKVLTRGPYVSLHNNVIKYSDDSHVPFDVILENLLHVSTLQYKFSPAENYSTLRTPQNIKNMVEVLSRPSNKICKLLFFGLSETFDISLFTPFLLKEKNMDVYLNFQGDLSDSFKRKLESVIDQVLLAFPPQDYPVIGCPYIHYNGLSEESDEKLWRVRKGPHGFGI